jgi:hypothetical protein
LIAYTESGVMPLMRRSARERAEDRDDADEQRQQRRDQAAKDPQREQHEQREGQQLGPGEILGDRGPDLLAGDGDAAELDAGTDAPGQPVAHVAAVGGRAQVGDDERAAPVAADQSGGGTVEHRDRPADAGIAGDRPLHAGQRGVPGRRGGQSGQRHERDDVGGGLYTGRPLQPCLRGDAGRGRVLEVVVARLEQAGGGAADRARDEHEGRGEREDALGSAGGEVSEGAQHGDTLPLGGD